MEKLAVHLRQRDLTARAGHSWQMQQGTDAQRPRIYLSLPGHLGDQAAKPESGAQHSLSSSLPDGSGERTETTGTTLAPKRSETGSTSSATRVGTLLQTPFIS